VAGKRILIDNGNWLQALARDNVDLVTEPIREITETGVVTTDGTVIDADVLIYGTGFTASKILSPIAITGRDGTRLDDQWDGDARAYLGITIPNFPNLFCLYGPNTNLVVNGSIIMFSECEVRYVMGCLAMLMDNGAKAIDCRPDVHDRYNEKIDAGNAEMAWGISKAPTWYRNEKGRIAQNWPFSLVEFWQQSRRPNIDDYQLLG
jgi:4-hydroxyacetophenone monooxygenase